jgi:type II secretory pathway pseudopilin PulG
MIALWLIEFLLIALVVIALVWAIQRMIARARSRERAQSYAQDLMRYDEARQLVLQQAQRLVEQGIPFEQAALTALSDDYWPDSAAGVVGPDRVTTPNAVRSDMTERKTKR